ncbi:MULTISPECIES: hypothetical protein [unclassified Haloparvum]|uniref:hypothetical protein n=1 Tax=Haloparvum sp. PAK95 TaxID=3418962 RepID=UPI003D2F39BF
MALKDIQCAVDGCGGMVQVTIDSNEEITDVREGKVGYDRDSVQTCPECGERISVWAE